MQRNGFSLIEGLLILLVVSILGFAGYYVYTTQSEKDDPTAADSTTNIDSTEPATKDENLSELVIPEGWVTFANASPKYSFAYPKEWGEVVANEPGYGSEKKAGLKQAFSFSAKDNSVLFALNSKDFGGIGSGQALPKYSGFEKNAEGYSVYTYDNQSELVKTQVDGFLEVNGGLLLRDRQRYETMDGVVGSDIAHVVFNIDHSDYDSLNFMAVDNIGEKFNEAILIELAKTVKLN